MTTQRVVDIGGESVALRPIADGDEASTCADIMSTSEPWLTLGRTRDQAMRILSDREVQEIYVAVHDGSIVGFLILVVKGAFIGYIRSVAVRSDWRSRGLGRHLVGFAEERCFRDSPNVFLCVSSFNPRARSLYERLGYKAVGELRDYIIRGASELIMRKTLGPHAEFARAERE